MWSRPGTFLNRAVQLLRFIQLLVLILKSDWLSVLKVLRAVILFFYYYYYYSLRLSFLEHSRNTDTLRYYYNFCYYLNQFCIYIFQLNFFMLKLSHFLVVVVFSSFHSSGWQHYFKNSSDQK